MQIVMATPHTFSFWDWGCVSRLSISFFTRTAGFYMDYVSVASLFLSFFNSGILDIMAISVPFRPYRVTALPFLPRMFCIILH